MTQVTRLCDLTNDNDTVTSVSWAERGNFVAVGTHRGYVQVIIASSFKKSHRSETLRNYLLKIKNPEDLSWKYLTDYIPQIWDVAAAKRVNVLSGHSAR